MPRSFYSCSFVFYPVHCVYYERESLISLPFLQWVLLALSTHLAVSISRYTREQMCLFGRISDTSSVLFIFLSLSWVMLFAHCPTHTLFRHQPATCRVYKQYQGSPSWGLFLWDTPFISQELLPPQALSVSGQKHRTCPLLMFWSHHLCQCFEYGKFTPCLSILQNFGFPSKSVFVHFLSFQVVR